MQPSPSAATEPASKISIVEVVAYAGITASLYGTFLVLAKSGPSQNTIGLVALALSILFLVAGAVIGADAPDRLARLRSVCWYLSVQAFSSMLQSWIEPDPLQVSSLFPVFLLDAVFAFVLWLFLPRLLQQLAFFGAALAALAVLVTPGSASLLLGPSSLTGLAMVFWLGGAVWFALGYAGRVRPPRTGMVLGVLASIPGPLFFATDSPEAAFLLVLATAIAYLILGGRIADRAVTGIAVVGAVVGVAGFLAAAGVDDTSSGAMTLVVGLVLLALGVLFARRSGGVRPTFGPPALPIGLGPARAADAPVAAPVVPPPPPEGPAPPPPATTEPPEGS
jgi:hypothetical protein